MLTVLSSPLVSALPVCPAIPSSLTSSLLCTLFTLCLCSILAISFAFPKGAIAASCTQVLLLPSHYAYWFDGCTPKKKTGGGGFKFCEISAWRSLLEEQSWMPVFGQSVLHYTVYQAEYAGQTAGKSGQEPLAFTSVGS